MTQVVLNDMESAYEDPTIITGLLSHRVSFKTTEVAQVAPNQMHSKEASDFWSLPIYLFRRVERLTVPLHPPQPWTLLVAYNSSLTRLFLVLSLPSKLRSLNTLAEWRGTSAST